jgi:hypothetical protein
MEVRSVRLQDLNFEDEQLKGTFMCRDQTSYSVLTVYSNAKSQNSTSSTVNHRIKRRCQIHISFQGVARFFRAKYSEALKKTDNYTTESRNRRNSKRFCQNPLKSKIGGGISGKIHPQDYQKQS